MTKIALITGCAKKIGKSMACYFLKHNYNIIGHANKNFLKLEKWTKEHEASQRIVGLIKADLKTADGQEHLVDQVKKISKKIDLIINNAALYEKKPIEQINRSDFQKMHGVNLEAPFFITKGLLPHLKKSDNACVINIIDSIWHRPNKYYSHYFSSKAALAIITRALASELAPHIRVNGISPGIMSGVDYSSEIKQRIINKIPSKRFGNILDLAKAAYFIAEDSPYMTGEIIAIDGGRSVFS